MPESIVLPMAFVSASAAVEDLHAVLERFGETLLFGVQHRHHELLLARQLGVGLAHQAREFRYELG